MDTSKSPSSKYYKPNKSVLKYRSCFNKGSESSLDRSSVENFYRMSVQSTEYELSEMATTSSNTTNDSIPSAALGEAVAKDCSLTSSEGNIVRMRCQIEKRSSKEEVNASKDVDGYVGFANLPNQVYWKAVKKGFEFTIMIVGASGLGKSTLLNSLFLSDIYSADYPGPTKRIQKTMSIDSSKVLLKEGGVSLLLTVIDTPGFGDSVDNSNCWVPITEFIENKYEDYFKSETKVLRNVVPDGRVHCCLFCIQATGHGLKPLDVEFMKHLYHKVNIVPIITKADTLTPEECTVFKEDILKEIKRNKIEIYEFPELPKEDEEYEMNNSLRKRVPFAVVGSNAVIEANGKKIRGREYPWGIVDIENLDHCDFVALRKMLICTHMQDLKDVTHNVHYENYRYNKLSETVSEKQSGGCEKLKQLELELKEKLEKKQLENMQNLQKYEEKLRKEYEATKKSLYDQEKKVEDKRKLYELEKETWEKENKINIDQINKGCANSSAESVDDKKDKKKRGLF